MDLNKKVLVVDDFLTARRIMKNILKQIGFANIFEAENGEAALKVLKGNDIDLVILDWNMPVMDGLEMLKAIRADEDLKAVTVLMVTAEGQKQNVVDAIRAGANGYVVKPYTAKTIKEKLQQIIGG